MSGFLVNRLFCDTALVRLRVLHLYHVTCINAHVKVGSSVWNVDPENVKIKNANRSEQPFYVTVRDQNTTLKHIIIVWKSCLKLLTYFL